MENASCREAKASSVGRCSGQLPVRHCPPDVPVAPVACICKLSGPYTSSQGFSLLVFLCFCETVPPQKPNGFSAETSSILGACFWHLAHQANGPVMTGLSSHFLYFPLPACLSSQLSRFILNRVSWKFIFTFIAFFVCSSISWCPYMSLKGT